MDQILTVVAAVEGSGEEIKTNSSEVRTDSSEVAEVVEDADVEVLEDKILTKDSVDAAVEGSVEEIEDSGEALAEENLVDGEALEGEEEAGGDTTTAEEKISGRGGEISTKENRDPR